MVEGHYGVFTATLIVSGADKTYFLRFGMEGFGYSVTIYQNNNLYYSEEINNANLSVLRKYFLKDDIFDISSLFKNIHKEGAKIATKVPEDGDLIEVDVNKGIVKIIK